MLVLLSNILLNMCDFSNFTMTTPSTRRYCKFPSNLNLCRTLDLIYKGTSFSSHVCNKQIETNIKNNPHLTNNKI